MGTNIARRRRLSDLYTKGALVRFNETGHAVIEGETIIDQSDDWSGGDDDVTVWVTPPNPLQREQAMRDSQAHRAMMTLSARKDDTPEGMAVRANVEELTLDELIDYLVGMGENDRQREAMREVASEDEWADLSELQDAIRLWEEAGSPDDSKWADLMARDLEYGEQVQKVADRLREAAAEGLRMVPRSELDDRAVRKRVEQVGSREFMRFYEREMLFYGCRDPEKRSELWFESSAEVGEQDEYVQDTLTKVLSVFITEAGEAKNSRRAARGSQQSAPPAEPATSEVSTPEEPTE